MKLLKKILPLALVVMGMAGCLKEQYEPVPAGRGGEVTLRVSVPGMATPSTRAFGEAQEKQVETLDVLVFNSDNKLVQWKAVASADINPNGDGLALKIRDLAENTGITIALVANVPATTISDMLTATDGINVAVKKDVLDKLTYAFTGARWVSSGAGAMYLPMYGEVAVSGNVYASATQAIEMKRMVAKIDVTNAVAATFKLTAVHLVNHNQAGYLAPKWDGTGAPVTESPQMPWIPANPDKKAWTADTDAQTYTVDAPSGGEQALAGEIYTFESWAAYNASEDPKAANPAAPATATRLILEGEYAGATCYYPVDFVYPQDGTAKTTKYMPLLRNHRYVVSIDAAEGKGYGTMGEAVAAYSALTNLKTRIIAYDEGKLRYMAFDGQYMIGMEKRTVAVSKEAQAVALALFTDNPAGWSAAITLDAADGANWLNIGGNSSATGAVGSATLNLTATANTLGRARTATVTLTAGRNRSVAVTVTQSDESQYYIRITDQNGAEIDGLTFGYYGATESDDPTAQRFYVSYNLPGNVTITAQGGGTFDYTASSDKPATTGTITGGAAMFNVQSAKATATDLLDPFFTKSTTLVFTGSDGTNTVTKNFELKQGDYNLVHDLQSHYYLINSITQTITIKTNTLWQVVSVTGATEVLYSPIAELLAQNGGNNTTTGDPLTFRLITDDEYASNNGKIIYVELTDPARKISNTTLAIKVSSCGSNGTAIPRRIGNNNYLVHIYGTGDNQRCWMVENSKEGTPLYTTYTAKTAGLRGYYYSWSLASQTNNACPEGWELPTGSLFSDVLFPEINQNLSLIGKWWIYPNMGGYRGSDNQWSGWDNVGRWWVDTLNTAYGSTSNLTGGPYVGGNFTFSVRCVEKQ